MSRRYLGGFITANPTIPTASSASGSWTLSQQLQYASTWPPCVDPLFEYVTLLLNGDGTNGGQNNTFLDSSTNNFAFTRTGSATQGSFSPYGTLWSIYSDGSGDYLSISDSASFPSGTTEFCYELWFYPTATTNGVLLAKGGDGGFFEQIGIQYNSSALKCYIANSSNVYIVNAGNFGTPTVGQWNHIAVYRSGNNFYGSLNGTVTSLATSSNSVVDNAAAFVVSGYSSPNPVASPVTGYISNLRLVTGSAVYGASNFTPPITPLTAITGTQLLMCQANRFIDNSSNAFSITVGGNPSVQRFSPFQPSASYDTSVIGGSGYFDGAGDYLTGPTNSAFNLGTGDFTVECWVYRTATGTGYETMLGFDVSGGLLFELYLGQLDFGIRGTANNVSGVTVPSFQWVHLALARQSGVVRYFQNGVLIYTYTGVYATQNFTNNTNALISGYAPGDGVFNGYINDLRLIKGTAIYTANFTPPTAPLTAIANTSLLLKFTNAAIPDYAMQNNLETVANAQISTSVTKFGTGSLAFDGVADCLFAPSANQSFSLGATFTIEFWIYNTKTSGFGGVIGHTGTNWYTGIPITYVEGGASTFGINSYAGSLTKSGLSNSTWYHIAIVSENNSAKLYVNGTLESGPLSQAVTGTPAYLTIGKHDGTNSIADFSGYLDDLRITKGVARYTTNFTPPTAPFFTY